MTAMGRHEYLRAIYDRYRRSSTEVKGKILDEYCRVCDCHRKHAIRLLNGPRPAAHPRPRRPRGPSYGRPVIIARGASSPGRWWCCGDMERPPSRHELFTCGHPSGWPRVYGRCCCADVRGNGEDRALRRHVTLIFAGCSSVPGRAP